MKYSKIRLFISMVVIFGSLIIFCGILFGDDIINNYNSSHYDVIECKVLNSQYNRGSLDGPQGPSSVTVYTEDCGTLKFTQSTKTIPLNNIPENIKNNTIYAFYVGNIQLESDTRTVFNFHQI